MASNDDAAKAIARKLIADYKISVSRVANAVDRKEIKVAKAREYQDNARKHAAQELRKLARGETVSKSMRKKIEDVANKVQGHDSDVGHGAWWASSGSGDNPSSWI